MPRNIPTAENPMNCQASYSPEEAQNTTKDNTAYRRMLLLRANEFYRAGKYRESVECQIEALCLGFRTKFFSNSPSNSSFDFDYHMQFLDNLEAHTADHKEPPELNTPGICALNEVLTEIVKETSHKPAAEIPPYDDARKLIEKCQSLPEEWTVMQLCKDFAPNTHTLPHSEIISKNEGIYLTLLKYPRAEINNHEPICVLLLPTKDSNIYEQMQKLAKTHQEIMLATDSVDKYKYWANMKQLDADYVKFIDVFSKWIGPWIVFFQGSPKDAKLSQEKIYDVVDDFVATQKLSKRQQILLSIICCDMEILGKEDVERVVEEIARNDKEKRKIHNFLTNVDNFENLETSSRFPALVIVDELLDQFPWEHLLPEMEMTRISSLHILLRLYEKYKSQIRNGYLQLTVERGASMINPEGDLFKMQKRMVEFFNYWLPQWKQHVQKIPTSEELKEILKSSDVFVYCGHGDALRYIKQEDLMKDSINCVVMLFGCESIKLKASGFSSEMIGAHLFYHLALCPLVVGATNVISDFPTDQVSARVLSSWITSKATKHFAYVDVKTFKDGKIEFMENSPAQWENKHNPSILSIFADIRRTANVALWLRASIILRGLPIWLSK